MANRRLYRRTMGDRARDRRTLAAQPSILASVSLSAAQREQGQVTVTDLALAARAQLAHPGVRWWWGEREQDGRRGAWCYLCERFITPGTVRAPLSRAAQAAILDHRNAAHGGGLTPRGSQPPASSAGADRPEGDPIP